MDMRQTIYKSYFSITAALMLIFGLLLISSAPSFAREPSSVALETERLAPATPALWKLSDADSEVWLFGTVHILDPSLSWHSEKVNAAFNQAKTLVLEAPVLDTPPADVQKIVMKYALNPAGVSLSSQLSDTANKQLINVLISFGNSPERAKAMVQQFEPLRPWFVGMQLAAMQAQYQGADPKAGVENILTEAAKSQKMSIEFLESVDQQFRFFHDLPENKAVQMLEESLDQLLNQPELMKTLVYDWRAGNVEKVGETMQASLSDPEIYSALLTSRNQDWAFQIKSIMDGSGTYFIAVGSAHLVGQGSVQDFLKLNGLTAIRIQ